MNKFCNDCDKRSVPKEIKNKFNKLAGELFFECPKNDKNIYGCTVKYLDIDWKNFVKYLKEQKQISESELKSLQKKGVI